MRILTLLLVLICNVSAYTSVLPNLPEPLKYGVGVAVNNNIYVGLGSMGQNWYKIDANSENNQWVKIASFPDVPREQATAITLNNKIYILGGIGKDNSGLTKVQEYVYVYDIKKDKWEKLLTRPPVSLAGHISFAYKDQIISFGGVNANIFNGLFHDINYANNNTSLKDKINENYFSKPEEDYFLNKQIISFSPDNNLWMNFGILPFAGTAGSSVVTDNNRIFLLAGERKPGLRSTSVWAGNIKDRTIEWSKLPSVAVPDGVSEAYGAFINGNLTLAGGAYFPGAIDNYNKGLYWSHKGLIKHYSKDIYQLRNDKWIRVASLPEGIAYGVSLPWKDGMLIIGGEKGNGEAISDIFFLKQNGDDVKVIK
ncbi:N-acetylneuraminate epimerase [Proteus mirabilis]|nr:N-acetylneuraminate epimerase [Proteus mirabilis]